MKIVFFTPFFKYRPTGISNLILDVINCINENPNINIILLGNKLFHEEVFLKIKNPSKIKIIINKNLNSIWGGFKINQIFKNEKFDYFFGTAGVIPFFLKNDIKKILYIHDFVYKEYSETMSTRVKIIMSILGDYSIKKADIIWSNSKYTMNQAEKYFNLENKIKYIGASVNKEIYKKLDLKLKEILFLKNKFKITKKSILFVGTLEPRKNIDYLISLMPKLELNDYQLLVVGGKGWGNTRIKNQIDNLNLKENTIIFMDYIQNKELVELYNVVDLYVSTSKNEGFGLPQLEAMSCGCPVVTAYNSAMIEVVEDGGKMIKGWNKDEWINGIEEVYTQKNIYSKLALEKSELYNWKEIIKNFFKKMKEK
ncbi:MAG: glycosyltransferase family 4 protein [Cetobacterium sp.]